MDTKKLQNDLANAEFIATHDGDSDTVRAALHETIALIRSLSLRVEAEKRAREETLAISGAKEVDELVREIGKGRDDNDWRPDPDTVEYIAKCLKRAVRANDDTAWLVEIDWGRLAWLSHFEGGFVVRWTNNASEALRFARKCDAASVAAVIGKGATAVEHAWMGPVCSDPYHGYQPPRPKNCAKPDDCGWHNIKTNPPSSLWTCFKCQRLSRAGEATLNEINQMKGTPK